MPIVLLTLLIAMFCFWEEKKKYDKKLFAIVSKNATLLCIVPGTSGTLFGCVTPEFSRVDDWLVSWTLSILKIASYIKQKNRENNFFFRK